MSIAEVSGVKAGLSIFGSSSSRNLAAAGAVSSGDFIVVMGRSNTSGDTTLPTVTDNLSTPTTYTVSTALAAGGFVSFVAYGFAQAAGMPTVTVTLASAFFEWFMFVDAFSGVNATPLDAAIVANAGSTSTPSVDITTNTAGAVIIAVACDQATNNNAITNNDGTLIFEYELGASNNRGSGVFVPVASPMTYTVDWDFTTAASQFAAAVSFAPAAGGTAITATKGVETWSGQGAIVALRTDIAAGLGVETWSGKTAVITLATNINTLTAVETWNGLAATVQVGGAPTPTPRPTNVYRGGKKRSPIYGNFGTS